MSQVPPRSINETLPPPNLDEGMAEIGSYSLVVCLPSGVRTYGLHPTGTHTIGRDESCSVTIADGSVSRNHAVIYGGLRPQIQDLGSRNGTRVSGRVLGAGERLELGPGSVVEVGAVSMFVQRVDTVVGGGEPTSFHPSTVIDGILCNDAAAKEVFQLAHLVAQTDVCVLILGETGVGKEILADYVHAASRRARAPLVKMNCAALPESMIESELFGYERGAFTGAVQAKVGLMESAEGGTLFLDEIGELPLATQAKLLRALETRQVTRLGSVTARTVDVRFVSATNRRLRERILAREFRSDLFYRINGMSLTMPTLRERRGDIVPMAQAFANRFAEKTGRPPPVFSIDALDVLVNYAWPGNIRELKNVVERAVLLNKGGTVRADLLGIEEHSDGSDPPPSDPPPVTRTYGRSLPDTADDQVLHAEIARRERERIIAALDQAGNQADAAKLLGISRRTLINRLDSYGIQRPRKGRT